MCFIFYSPDGATYSSALSQCYNIIHQGVPHLTVLKLATGNINWKFSNSQL